MMHYRFGDLLQEYPGGHLQNALQKITQHVIAFEICEENTGPPVFTGMNVCAQNAEEDKNGCKGDSGGPLINAKTKVATNSIIV